MARIFELVFVAFLLYFAFRRIVAPLSRGYEERERERREEEMGKRFRNAAPASPKIDRTHAQDADFKDLA
ncbi:MAG TPA: hypothetical protein VFH95_03360 [Candidatus Kapabacteria bacterium]|nr:hypothetical protein [Candidatus Kapabacteria bacterium]